MGEIVTDRLDESFNNLMNYAFTADLEGQLDRVATGERNWKELLDTFYGDFKKRLTNAQGEQECVVISQLKYQQYIALNVHVQCRFVRALQAYS